MRLISNYISSIEDPEGLFRSLTDDVCFERNDYKELYMIAGSNACIFKLAHKGKPAMLKCYTAELAFLREKYNYLNSISSRYIYSHHLLGRELYVCDALGCGSWTDVLLGTWVEGETLSCHIEWAALANNKERLKELSIKFDLLAQYLRSQPWAHGDLKPDNIMVNSDDEFVLIDFDSLYYPSAPKQANQSLGTASYQHPDRKLEDYNADIDDYSLTLISMSLHALSLKPGLYREFHRGDNIIFEPSEIVTLSSKAFSHVQDLYKDNQTFSQLLNTLTEPCIKHE